MLRTLSLLLLLCASYGCCVRLVNFQVAQPPPLPQEAKKCTVPILQRTFGFSFGQYALRLLSPRICCADVVDFSPEVVNFTPPTDCGTPGSWAGVSLNFTVTSNGTQFDRLAIFTFQNVEIWRTSTPEPVKGDGIIWTYLKDVTRFTPLFSKPGTFILQLDNLIQPGLDGEYATTLEATFFASSSQFLPAPRADLIVPLTTLANDTGNDASVPPGFSLNVTLPRNAVAAFAELQASGNGNEEFWYFNVPNQFLGDFPVGTTFGEGPFREVRVLVDGKLAGVAFPYAVIFTGGIVPTAWRPITSYGALDLPVYHIDLTPFIPILTDGKPHNITLDIASAEPDHQINQNWFISGLLQVKLDSSTAPTTGKITRYEAPNFATSSASSSARGVDVNITLKASRRVHIEAEIIAGSGTRTKVVFSQDLEYKNVQNYLQNFTTQNLFQATSGQVLSRHNGKIALQDTFSYPLTINFTSTPDGRDFSAEFDHSYNRILLPAPFILGTTIAERQLAGGSFHIASTGNTGSNGTSNNTFSYHDTAGNTYTRQVNASLNVITFDRQGGNLASSTVADLSPPTSVAQVDMKARLLGGRVIGGT
ncbi:peptide N-acetyl-beta-D-glucosaminyl asparaginase amidase A-domain-containing protein [Lactarius akahatsu]|uniref:Peptide N-acetyl-beta-D-glucosaminyl asparaginase amidase A-domain-containing protein n=1 Tax=Lactarius akahatsu TaxID=416441 RepID=A0AAD4QC33_9AGAM|nr:peptide N-acetyl-beta-D-glucosaminyl asparaginase amidase A-domain-containing protein [Lactarius akahatsu]